MWLSLLGFSEGTATVVEEEEEEEESLSGSSSLREDLRGFREACLEKKERERWVFGRSGWLSGKTKVLLLCGVEALNEEEKEEE